MYMHDICCTCNLYKYIQLLNQLFVTCHAHRDLFCSLGNSMCNTLTVRLRYPIDHIHMHDILLNMQCWNHARSHLFIHVGIQLTIV